ncbi:MAG: sodium:solute symporter family protein [Chloroflexota bacterium]
MTYLAVPLLGIYTVLLIYLGRLGRKRSRTQNFIHGGRQFSSWQVFVLISALWCSWIFIVEVETAYLFGISAIWFGVSVAIMAVASVFILATPFRKLSYVTSSGIIGERFGPSARALAAIVIGFTFPVFAMSNVLAAAAFLNVVLGWPLLATLAATVLVVVAYIVLGGVWALAYTQVANFIVMSLGLVVGSILALHAVPLSAMTSHLAPRYFSLSGIGIGIILTWLFSDLLNVVSAQAEFQILLAATDMSVARRGLYWSVVSIFVFTVLSVVIGMAARVAAPAANMLGVLAFPYLYLHNAPPVAAAFMALAVWAAALTWSAPLMFSGASSLGADVLGLFRSLAKSEKVRFCVRVCLPLQAVLIVLFASMRPEDLAWWQVFGLTVRNGAIFAPTVALLAWPMTTRAAAISGIVGGSLSGIFWNALTGFSATRFELGLNPMWISSLVGIVLVVTLTLVGSYRRSTLAGQMLRTPLAMAAVGLGAVLIVGLIFFWQGVSKAGFLGPGLLLLALDALLLASLVVRPRPSAVAAVEAPALVGAGGVG